MDPPAVTADDDPIFVEPPPPAPQLPHRPPVWLEMAAQPSEAWPGELVTLTMRIRAEADLAKATMKSVLPQGLVFEAVEGDSASYVPAERTLVWPLPQIRQGDIPELRFHLRIGEAAPDLMVEQAELWASGFVGPAVGRVVIKRLFPPTETRITPEGGGELRSADGRVYVIFPAGTASQPIRVEHRPIKVDLLAAQQPGLALQFELNAFTDDATATPVHQFAKPLELRVNLAGLIEWNAMPFYQHPFLGYQEEGTGEWVALQAQRQGDVLIASLNHLSYFGGGTGSVHQTGWVLAYNDAHVSTFSGGLNYIYPIEVPAGRGGLTPDLALSYNSRRVDGILTWVQSDWVGLGWTLDTMEIVRKITPDYTYSGGKPAWYWASWVGWQNKFTLLYKGTGYKLIAGSTNPYGRYYCEDEQFLYIERRNDAGGNGSPDAGGNVTSEYWIVRLRDGTEYRLGYNEDSEQTVTTNYYDADVGDTCHWSGGNPPTTEACYAGDTMNTIAFRWRVDRILDQHGNKIEFVYAEEDSTSGSSREKASYLSEVRYNWIADGGDRNDFGTKVSFARASRSDLGDTSDPNVHYFYQDQYLTSIKVENWNQVSNQFNTVREYDLNYDKRSVPGGEHDNRTRRLDWIKKYGTDGIGGDYLPITDFTYDVYRNKGWACVSSCTSWDQESFRYERLTQISNGYGGTISLTYESPDQDDYQYWMAWNYRVSGKTVDDNNQSGYKIAYSYPSDVADRCYDNNDTYGCEYYQPGQKTGGNLVGYETVTEQLKKPDNTLISKTVHDFKLNSEASPTRDLGREWQTRYQDASSVDQKKTVTTWQVETLSGPTRYFVYAQWVEEYLRENGALPGSPQKKTAYAYETSRQGNGQYGNLTYMEEYDGATLYRKTFRAFYPNSASDKWIVDRVAAITVADSGSVAQTKTKNYYDGNAAYDSAPVRGDITKVERTTTAGASPVYITVQTTTYDASYYYLPTQVRDGNNNLTQISYDSVWKMYPITVTNALSQSTTYTYNYILGKVTTETGPNGSSTAINYEFDDFGRLTKIIRPGDSSTYPTTLYEYYDVSSFTFPLKIITKERVTSGQATTIPTMRFYDGLGRLIQENRGPSNGTSNLIVANKTYNAQGLEDKVYVPYTAGFSWNYVSPDPNQPKATYAYDALGRVTSVTNTDSTVVYTDYNGLRQAVRDEKSHQKIYRNDPFGRLVEVKEFTGTFGSVNWNATPYATTTYAYNHLDLLTGVTDAASNSTSITYDAMGRKTQMTDPDMGTWYYTYDNASNLTRQKDAKNQRICFYYDALNRLTGKQYRADDNCQSGSPNPTYSYDSTSGGNLGIGYRTGMSDPSGSTSWKYDARGRVIEESKVISSYTFKTQWTYNARDLVLTQVYPGGTGGQTGETVTTSYDVYGRPSTLTGTSNYVTGTDYTPEGRIDLLKLGNTAANPTLKTDYIYYSWTTANGRGRLQQLKTGTPSVPDSLQDLRYQYDAVGNVTQVQDYKAGSPETLSYSYDDLDRLTAISGGYSESIAYNTIGNITSKAGSSYSYTGGKPHAVTAAGSYSYGYDANGNTTSRTVGSSFTLTYDYENRLTGVSGGASATFTYDGDGNRVKGVVGGVTTYYVGNYYEYSSTVKKYYYHAGKRIAMYDSSTLYWLVSEHLGSTTITANSSGSKVAEIRYKAYGASRYTYGTTPTTYHFTGQREESTIGLYYYGARWYDAALGRFVQADTLVQTSAKGPEASPSLVVSYASFEALRQWNEFQRAHVQPEKPDISAILDPQLLNRYSYARNNPLAYVDDSGHAIWWVVGGVVGGIVGFGAYALTHRDNFDWKQAALWTAGGAIAGGTLGAGAQWVAGALGAKAAATTAGAAAGTVAVSPAGQQILNATSWQHAEQLLGQFLNMAKNTQGFFVQGMSTYRIPDFANLTKGFIADVKWVQHLTMSQQLRDLAVFAQQKGIDLVLFVRHCL